MLMIMPEHAEEMIELRAKRRAKINLDPFNPLTAVSRFMSGFPIY